MTMRKPGYKYWCSNCGIDEMVLGDDLPPNWTEHIFPSELDESEQHAAANHFCSASCLADHCAPR